MNFKDKTFCASPNCKNDCGRKMTDEEKVQSISSGLFVSYAYFCGEPAIISENKPIILKS